MPSFTVLMPIGLIAISFLAGFIFFYVMVPLGKEVKKQQAEAVLSLLINFVIYMWVSKVLLNLSTFIKDPLAVLSYPGNSHAFYFAVLLTILHTVYKIKRHGAQAKQLFHAFAYVFIFASFVYECMDIVLLGNRYTWGYLSLLFILLLILVLLPKVPMEKMNIILLLVWGLGKLLLALILPFTTVFGYLLKPWFLTVLIAVSIYFILIHRKLEVKR